MRHVGQEHALGAVRRLGMLGTVAQGLQVVEAAEPLGQDLTDLLKNIKEGGKSVRLGTVESQRAVQEGVVENATRGGGRWPVAQFSKGIIALQIRSMHHPTLSPDTDDLDRVRWLHHGVSSFPLYVQRDQIDGGRVPVVDQVDAKSPEGNAELYQHILKGQEKIFHPAGAIESPDGFAVVAEQSFTQLTLDAHADVGDHGEGTDQPPSIVEQRCGAEETGHLRAVRPCHR